MRQAEVPFQEMFRALYRSHFPRVFSFVFRQVSTPQEAEDLTQEVFALLFARLTERAFGEDEQPVSWLFGVARKLILNHNWLRNRWLRRLSSRLMHSWRYPYRSRRLGESKVKRSPVGRVVDFANGKVHSGLKQKLRQSLRRKLRRTHICFLQHMNRDSHFWGGTVVFRIKGSIGRVHRVEMRGGGHGLFVHCISRHSASWTFPKFSGNADVYIPVRLSSMPPD